MLLVSVPVAVVVVGVHVEVIARLALVLSVEVAGVQSSQGLSVVLEESSGLVAVAQTVLLENYVVNVWARAPVSGVSAVRHQWWAVLIVSRVVTHYNFA